MRTPYALFFPVMLIGASAGCLGGFDDAENDEAMQGACDFRYPDGQRVSCMDRAEARRPESVPPTAVCTLETSFPEWTLQRFNDIPTGRTFVYVHAPEMFQVVARADGDLLTWSTSGGAVDMTGYDEVVVRPFAVSPPPGVGVESLWSTYGNQFWHVYRVDGDEHYQAMRFFTAGESTFYRPQGLNTTRPDGSSIQVDYQDLGDVHVPLKSSTRVPCATD